MINQASLERGPIHPLPGWVEMNPERDIWRAVVQVVQKLLAAPGISMQSVQVVGICGLVPCLCPIDEAGDPVGEMILYSDNRALAELDWVNRETGLNLTAEAVIPKLVWIRSHQPERFHRIRTVFSAHNYAVFRLTGERSIDYDTSGILGGIFDVRSKSWSVEILRCLDLPASLFPDPRPATALVGRITPTAARQTGLPAGIPVIAGSGDTFPTLLGCGVVDPGDAMVSFGTTGLLTLTTRPLELSSGGPHFDDGSGNASVTWIANVLSAGSLVNWFCEQFGQAENQAAEMKGCSLLSLLDSQAGQIPPGSDGLIVLPHWLGRRSPMPDPLLRGAMIGFTPSHTPAHIFRAILESFAFNLRQTYATERTKVLRLVATAGGARSALWRQIVADVLGTSLEYYQAASGSLGIAYLAGYATGLIPDFRSVKTDWLKEPIISNPVPACFEVYNHYYELYCQFEHQMTAPFAQLAAVVVGKKSQIYNTSHLTV